MIESGELRERWSNEYFAARGDVDPAIFEKAMLRSDDYDEALAQAARDGLSAREVYRRLASGRPERRRRAARVHEATGGLDGYVSSKVAAALAHDTPGTLEQRGCTGLVSGPT